MGVAIAIVVALAVTVAAAAMRPPWQATSDTPPQLAVTDAADGANVADMTTGGARPAPTVDVGDPAPARRGRGAAPVTPASAPAPAPEPAPTPPRRLAAPAPPPSPPPPAASAAAPVLDAVCTLPPDRPGLPTVELRYPSAWHVVGVDGACGYFDADTPEHVPAGTDWFHVDVWWKYDVMEFDGAGEPSPTSNVTSVTETTVADRAAVRVTDIATGQGLYPAGERATTWVIDLGEADGQAVTLLGVARDLEGAAGYDRAVTVLDRMAEQLVIAAP